MLTSLLRRWRARQLIARVAKPRRIRVHSVAEIRDSAGAPLRGHRVAFAFLEAPGPWSVQFYEAAPGQESLINQLTPGCSAGVREGKDGVRTRVLTLETGEPLWPR